MMMIPINHLTKEEIHPEPIGKRMWQGGLIALVVIAYFLIGSKGGDPAWGKYWMVRPVIVTPLAGAIGGMFYFFMDRLRYQGGWRRVAANVISLLIYTVGLWMGIVLGLAGTMWN